MVSPAEERLRRRASAPVARAGRARPRRGDPGVALLGGGPLGVDDLLGRVGGAAGRAGEAGEVAGAPVDHAAEVAGDAHRPGDRACGAGRSARSISSSSSSGVAAGPVPLVDEREQREAAVAADLEQLEGLRLDALGGVEHHHRGVDGGEHPVGVLGEVAVAGGVEQVDDAVAVGELQHGRGDRDAALLLELHPVRGGRAALAAGLDRAGAGVRARRRRAGTSR